MSAWRPVAEFRVDLHRDEVRAFVRAQIPGGLRRAGISAEFTVATAAACWRHLDPVPASPRLAMIWTSLCLAGTESAACLKDLLEGEMPMPFQFIASQPHTAAVHAASVLPGLVSAMTLHAPTGMGEELEDLLLPTLARRQVWTHALLGEVWTPHGWQEDGDRFRASWRLLVGRE